MKLTQILRLLDEGWQIRGRYGDFVICLKDAEQPVDTSLIQKLCDLHLIKMSGVAMFDLSREGLSILLEVDKEVDPPQAG